MRIWALVRTMLGSPIAFWLVLLLIFLNACQQPHGKRYTFSEIGDFAASLTFRATPISTGPRIPTYGVDKNATGQWTFVGEPWSGNTIGVIILNPMTTQSGFWSLIVEEHFQYVHFLDANGNVAGTLTPADRLAIIQAIEAAQPGTIDPARVNFLAGGGGIIRSKVLWWGVANNAWVAALFIILIASAYLNVARMRTQRRLRSIAECWKCGYSRAGLSATTCPECGANLPAIPAPQPTPKADNIEGDCR